MSCYLRHLEEFFEVLGLQNSKVGRKQLDLAIKKYLGLGEAHCPEVWQKLKEVLAVEEEKHKLINELREELNR